MLKNVKIYTITRFARYNPNNPDRPPRDSAEHKKSPEGLSLLVESDELIQFVASFFDIETKSVAFVFEWA